MTHPDTCPDAEMLAAWYDQALPTEERTYIEAHVSTCDRCQTIVATLARTDVPLPVPAPVRGWVPWRWVAPLAAGVAAVAVWAIVREPATPTPPAPASMAARAEPTAVPPAAATAPPSASAPMPAPRNALKRAPSGAPRQDAPAPIASAPAPEARSSTHDARANTTAAGFDATAPSASPAPTPAAPPAANTARALQMTLDAAAAPDIVSTDPAARWRIRGAAIERSTDGGATWTPQTTDRATALTSGAAPSPDVCWIVGRGGTVLRTTDGRTWRTIAFPERVDLIRVDSRDASTATVTTADARRFTTDDGGATWKVAGPQEF